MSQKREHYRIQYPESARPRLLVGGFELDVFDLSESGASLTETALFEHDAPPREVSIVFSDGSEFSTTAVFVRTIADGVAIRFVKLVPLARIFSEQRHLRQRFLEVASTAGRVGSNTTVKPEGTRRTR